MRLTRLTEKNMKNKIKISALSLLLLVLAFAAPSHAQQATLVQTTLSSAVAGQLLGAGVLNIANPPPQLVQLTSVTGILGLNPNLNVTASQPQQFGIYVDRELMAVTAVNGTTLTVVRGYSGTVATPHQLGAMVLYGQLRLFYPNDPGGTGGFGGVGGASCTTANVLVTPWLNYRTGAQWLCSTITSTWVPGFNNPLVPGSSVTNTAVASAAGVVLPSGPLFHVTGALAITGFTIPVGCNATTRGGCAFTIIPDGAFTWTAAGNISIAGTAVVGVALTFIWDASTQKWIPSYNLVTV